MGLLRATYRRIMHYWELRYALLLTFGITYYFLFFYQEDNDQLSVQSECKSKSNHIITFWSNDYHISPIHDLKDLLKVFNVSFIDHSLSAHCNLTKSCATNLRILSRENAMNPSQAIRKQFYEYYKDDSLMRQADAFVCFFPPAMCELFMPFNRAIIVIAAVRYEVGRFSVDDWNQWNKNLRIIASDPRNIIAGNNLYDAEYIRYFTGINATVLPSICSYTNTIYDPSKAHPEYIFFPSRESVSFNRIFLKELNISIAKFNSSIIVKSIRDLYKFYNYSDLAQHPAIIYLPYTVSTMSIFEQYTMNIPLFFPSVDLLTKWHIKYSVVYDRTWDKILTGIGKNHSTIPAFDRNSKTPDPNNEYDYSCVYYWLRYSDFYQWPHITYFNSIDDLTLKLLNTNLTFISEQMSIYNHKRRQTVLAQWKTILHRISPSSIL